MTIRKWEKVWKFSYATKVFLKSAQTQEEEDKKPKGCIVERSSGLGFSSLWDPRQDMGAWSNTFLITQDLIPTAPPPPTPKDNRIQKNLAPWALKPWDLY